MFVRFADLTEDDLSEGGLSEGGLAALADAVAIMPLAALETHGPHLPLGTDATIAEGILDHAERLDRGMPAGGGTAGTVLRLPVVWLGASAEHADRAGTLSREPEALIADIVAAGAGLARTGVRRILLFNAHGGNVAAAQIAALKLRTRHGLLAASVHWLDLGLPEGLTPPAPVAEDVHGGWIETSAMLHLAPAAVKIERARAQPPRAPAPCLFPHGPVAWGWTARDLAAGGCVGRPDLADRALGRMLVEHAAARLLSVLSDLARASWR